MNGHAFTDASGQHWRVIDFRVEPGKGKKRVPLSSEKADARAFVPVPWSGKKADVWVYRFGPSSTRFYDSHFLQGHLDYSYPATASAAERMQSPPRVARSRQ